MPSKRKSSDERGGDGAAQRPALQSEHASDDDRNFVSHGTKIFAMQPGEASPAIPALDARTLGLSICPWPFSDRDYGLPFFASAAGKLLAFTGTDAVYLGDQPPYGSRAPWSWTAIEARSPFYASQAIFSRSAEEEPVTLTDAGGGRESKMCSGMK
ncbi:hypothetical protein C2845_PM11G23110 [Panicum miliaceum]|uniref:Uncharacterized protein n=1 Tax=Panicum miliaceum TaxID=4540 RepID=A0A3L6RW54_PANMI|nr:hypothetical protein C2845_PM11G23110 [Panicum miliaceum]